METKKEPQLIIEIGGQSRHHPPVCAGADVGLPTSLIFLWMLSCSHSSVTHFVEFTQGEAEEEHWSSVIYSSFLFL